jgi:hypothetical protein
MTARATPDQTPVSVTSASKREASEMRNDPNTSSTPPHPVEEAVARVSASAGASPLNVAEAGPMPLDAGRRAAVCDRHGSWPFSPHSNGRRRLWRGAPGLTALRGLPPPNSVANRSRRVLPEAIGGARGNCRLAHSRPASGFGHARRGVGADVGSSPAVDRNARARDRPYRSTATGHFAERSSDGGRVMAA